MVGMNGRNGRKVKMIRPIRCWRDAGVESWKILNFHLVRAFSSTPAYTVQLLTPRLPPHYISTAPLGGIFSFSSIDLSSVQSFYIAPCLPFLPSTLFPPPVPLWAVSLGKYILAPQYLVTASDKTNKEAALFPPLLLPSSVPMLSSVCPILHDNH